ncbi:MAG: hypothetical protein GY926_18265 [bacterium]|nr:hypothetical protein [bacterium]MCP4967161.1 hypothetical protein [bacterium]
MAGIATAIVQEETHGLAESVETSVDSRSSSSLRRRSSDEDLMAYLLLGLSTLNIVLFSIVGV